MLWVVSPVDQTLSTEALLVRITLSPEQNEVGPLAEIVGAGGTGSTTTGTEFEVSETQPLASMTIVQ